MSSEIVSLENVTDEEFRTAKREAEFGSTNMQNYHCMLSGWVNNYVQASVQQKPDEEMVDYCRETIGKIFDLMETEPKISGKTRFIYKILCDYLFACADDWKDNQKKAVDVAQRYLS